MTKIKYCFSFCIIIVLLIIAKGSLYANLADPHTQGLKNSSQYFMSESFTPMTFFSEGAFDVVLMPMYFKIDIIAGGVGNNNSVDATDTYGYALSTNFNYAVNDRWFINLSYTGMTYDGDMTDITNNSIMYTSKDSITTHTLQLGGGYDLWYLFSDHQVHWSFPVFCGVTLMYYDIDITQNNSPFSASSTNIGNYTGSGVLKGYSLGAGASLRFSFFEQNFIITLYTLYVGFMDEYNLDYTYNGTTINQSYEAGGDFYPGLRFTYLLPDSHWSFSLSVSGLVGSEFNYYNEKFLSGLKIYTASLALTYRGNL